MKVFPKLKKKKVEKIRVGWREWISLPELGIKKIKVKVDTGARTSALHASNIEEFRRSKKKFVRFEVANTSKVKVGKKKIEALILGKRAVSDSGGHLETRYFISTRLKINGYTWEVEISLTDRSTMRFPMLLGRTAMKGHMVVDPDKSYLQSSKFNKRKTGALTL